MKIAFETEDVIRIGIYLICITVAAAVTLFNKEYIATLLLFMGIVFGGGIVLVILSAVLHSLNNTTNMQSED